MKLLFFPSDRGGGFGHVSRCVVLGQEANNRGHSCAFVMHDKEYRKRLAHDFDTYGVSSKKTWHDYASILHHVLSTRLRRHEPPTFTEISGVDFQAVRDGLTDGARIKYLSDQYERLITSFKPDVLVGDTNLLAWIVARKLDIPVIQIVRFASHPQTAKLIWWKETPNEISPPDITEIFNPIITQIPAPAISKAADLLRGDLYLVPSISEIEPIPPDKDTFHVGHLCNVKPDDPRTVLPIELEEDRPLIYVTIGGGAGGVGSTRLFRTIAEAFADVQAQVVVSTSEKFRPAEFSDAAKHIRFLSWVPGSAMISRAVLTVFHGGYGTMMETVIHGKPSVIIPFHTEQEGNGRRLEQLGCGRVLRLSRQPYLTRTRRGSWGECSYVVQNGYDLKPSDLLDAVDTVIKDDSYSMAARALQRTVGSLGGAQQALDLIEQRFL